MEHLLKPGAVLDGRYRVERVLGEGGFGITYCAENTRIGLRVAIKELFWQGHSTLDVESSLRVCVSRPTDREFFQAQKERFLKEARILRDFSALPGIAHILDYFEENDTAYIVMEYVEGATLGRFLSEHGGQMDPEILLRRALPLIDSLEQIHRCGVIHRDISPDNIMVAPDGALRIIDFGAARHLAPDRSGFTAIVKACYTPAEQYDRNGRQGPWTDVYALCATLYHCVTGAPPEGAIQRMFLDELQTPSQLGLSIRPEYEAILMKGLELDTAKRYPSMEALGSAIRAVLPSDKPQKRSDKKKLLLSFTAGIACLAVLIGAWLYARDAAANRFRGVETERMRFTAPSDMTAAEFADAQAATREWLEGFAGRDNYLMSVDGTHIDITVPLSLYEGREIKATTVRSIDSFNESAEGGSNKSLDATFEIKANWEDPAASLIAGKNQALPRALHEDTLIFSYGHDDDLTPGQRANLLVDFKARLDALDVPYAFGTLYGDDDSMVVCMPPRHIGRGILSALGENALSLSGESIDRDVSFNSGELEPLSGKDGARGLRCRFHNYYGNDNRLETLTRALIDSGESKVYLQLGEYFPIAEAEIEGPILDGGLDFTSFRVEEFDPLDEQGAWLVDFVDAVLNRTHLPAACSLRQIASRSADGSPAFDTRPEDCLGVHILLTDGDQALLDTMIQMDHDGMNVGWRQDPFDSYPVMNYFIYLSLEPDASFVENVAQAIPALLEEYNLRDFRGSSTVMILPLDEQGGERCRIILDYCHDDGTAAYRPRLKLACKENGRLKSHMEALRAWWEYFDAEALGFLKDNA